MYAVKIMISTTLSHSPEVWQTKRRTERIASSNNEMAENLEQNTTKSATNYGTDSTEEIRNEFLLTEDNLKNVLDCKLQHVKEEIAAQSLILSALSGGAAAPPQHHDVQNLSRQSCELQKRGDPDLSLNSQEVISSIENLAFDVSQAIGVELVQQQHHIQEEETQGRGGSSGVVNSSATSSIAPSSDQIKAEDFLNRQQLNSALESELSARTSATSVVLNAIAIKGENGVTEIQFSPIEGSELIDQVEVDAINSEPHHETEIGSTINEEDISEIAGNEIELPAPDPPKYPKLFVATTAQEAHEIIKRYAEETMSTFVSMRKMKQFGITGKQLCVLLFELNLIYFRSTVSLENCVHFA